MNVRVVRFTGVDATHMEGLLANIKEADGPPPGVPPMKLRILFDQADSTAIVLQEFANAQDMDAAARIFDAMDASETPGTRSSVDSCELKLELSS
jgi:hypothetical protein